MRVARKIQLTSAQSEELGVLARSRTASVRLAQRATIVLAAARGARDDEIATEFGVTRRTAGRWRQRYAELGLAGIERDAPRGGRKRQISEEEIVRRTTQERPSDATHWSTRSLAKAMGISAASVRRAWVRNGLKPHLTRTFKVSTDPKFLERLEDVVGLYLNPPEHAIVLCVDEKSQIQALDRTQPSLPLKKGRCGTMTHDYKRNGTTTLFAALSAVDGSVIGTCMPKHRHQEWLKFLQLIDRTTPPEKDLHLIADNYATHKHPRVRAWLAKHPRFHMHFTPTSASWLNMVERFFRNLTQKQIRRGIFQSVDDLIAVITGYLERHNHNPSPITWTATAPDILAKVQRARARLNKRPTA